MFLRPPIAPVFLVLLLGSQQATLLNAFSGFGFPPLQIQSPAFLSPPVNPLLDEYSSAQSGISIKIRLDVIGRGGDANSNSGGAVGGGGGRLSIDGIHLVLDGEALAGVGSKDRPLLPGADGPHPSLSSGPRSLLTVNDGAYVDMTGLRQVGLESGCWEMIWRKDAAAGSVICAFEHPAESRRNAHSPPLPRGRLYMSFPVFPRDWLSEGQSKKARVTADAEKFTEEIQSQFEKMRGTDNPLMKALHFRNACAAQEGYDRSGVGSMKMIPEDDDVMTINGGLAVCLEGTLWTKDKGFWGGNHVLLGTARIKPETVHSEILAP